jgi:hypothetical protein
MAACIFKLGTRWRRMVSITPRPLYFQGMTIRYSLDRRVDTPQIRSGGGGEEEKYPFIACNSNRILVIQLIT